MEKIHDIVFENKELIPDNVYVEIMNTLKEIPVFFEIEYWVFTPKLTYETNGCCGNGLTVRNKKRLETKILKINNTSYEYKALTKVPFQPFIADISNFHEFLGNRNEIDYKTDIITNPDPDDYNDDFDRTDDILPIKIKLDHLMVPSFLIVNVKRI